jgi:hypothetical protein
MNNCSVVVMQSPTHIGVWLARCYKDGNLDHVEELMTPSQAQDYAAEWISDQVDNNTVD